MTKKAPFGSARDEPVCRKSSSLSCCPESQARSRGTPPESSRASELEGSAPRAKGSS